MRPRVGSASGLADRNAEGPRLCFRAADTWAQILLWGEDRPVHCGMLSSTPGLHPPDASSAPSLRTIINVPRHHQVSPKGQNHPR